MPEGGEKIYMTEASQPAPDTNNLTLKGDEIPEGSIVEITIIAVKDETTSGKTMRIGYERAGTQYWIMEHPAATNYHGIELVASLFLNEYERPIGMVESPTQNDVCKLFVRGKYVE